MVGRANGGQVDASGPTRLVSGTRILMEILEELLGGHGSRSAIFCLVVWAGHSASVVHVNTGGPGRCTT